MFTYLPTDRSVRMYLPTYSADVGVCRHGRQIDGHVPSACVYARMRHVHTCSFTCECMSMCISADTCIHACICLCVCASTKNGLRRHVEVRTYFHRHRDMPAYHMHIRMHILNIYMYMPHELSTYISPNIYGHGFLVREYIRG